MSLRFLSLLLSLICLTISANVTVHSSDYYDSNESVFACLMIAGQDSGPNADRLTFTSEILNERCQKIKHCLSDLAKTNSKVKQDESTLADKMCEFNQFLFTERVVCLSKASPFASECFDKAPKNDCERYWHTNGCSIKVYEKYCAKGFVNKLAEFYDFQDSNHKQCRDKYKL